MKKAVEHIDPIRHPNVFEPIEKEVLEIHSVGDLSEITAQDVSEIFDASIGSDNEKYFDVED